MAATWQLSDAIAGVQEAPPNKLLAITTLCHIFLGKLPSVPIPINLPPASVPTPPVTSIALLSLANMDNVPIHMWDPLHMPNHFPTLGLTTIIMYSNANMVPTAIIKDDDSKPTTAPSVHQNQPRLQHCRTQAQHCTFHIHLINLAVTKALMPMINIKPTTTYPSHRYIVATHSLLENTYGISRPTDSPTHVDSLNFIGTIIDNITGNVLEYRHLMKSNKHRSIWQHSISNERRCLFQGMCDIKGTDTHFFIAKDKMPCHKRATYGCICCNYCPQ
jgi:hypothetical protein